MPVIAFCWNDWESLFLLITRLTIIAGCGYGAVFYTHLGWRQESLGIVPTWLYRLVALLMASVAVMVCFWIATCHEVLNWGERTFYGMSLIWIIILQLAIQRRGNAEITRLAIIARKYEEAVLIALKEKGSHPE